MQSKAFYGVQEISTMQRYAKYWSGLIVFLLHAIAEDNEGPFSAYYLDTNPRLQEMVQRVNNRLEALLATDLADINLQSLFPIDSDDEQEMLLVSPEIRLYAKALHTAVQSLSIFLVRFEHEESSFTSPVIGYMALQTLESNGAWIPAHNFTFVLSGMIHCMQLWLLGYYY